MYALAAACLTMRLLPFASPVRLGGERERGRVTSVQPCCESDSEA
jgi:hypothetical protein